MNTVSIIIRTRNEADSLPGTLQVLNAQTGVDFEIIGVDSGSTDDSVRLLEEAGAQVLQIDAARFSYGRALNLGCNVARGEFLLLLSAHAIPQGTDWISRMIEPLQRSQEIAGVSGAENGRIPGMPGASEPVVMDQACYESNPYAGLTNSNAVIRKALWQEFPFNEELTGAEDKEWTWRVLKSGRKVMLLPGVSVDHYHNEGLALSYRRGYREHLAFREFGAPVGNYGVIRMLMEVMVAPFRSLGGELGAWPCYAARCWGKYRGLAGHVRPDGLYGR